MKIIIFGANGQLGQELMAYPVPASWVVVGLSRTQVDITHAEQVSQALRQHQPDVMINAAAYTQVDRAETEVAAARAINVEGPMVLARASRESKIPLIHLSTDYVFNGQSPEPYRESDATDPQSVYGLTKLQSEQAIAAEALQYVIIRTSWVFGRYGKNFVKTMLKLMQERTTLSVVNDQLGGPTATIDLARMLWAVSQRIVQPGFREWGLYHYCGAPAVTWYEFAKAIMPIAERQGGAIKELLPISTAQYPTPAKRPAYSVLDTGKMERVFNVKAGDWRRALQEEFGG